MIKQLEIFHTEVDEFKKDKSIKGVLLTGSVASNTATETSDLDIVVLCDKDEFISKIVDEILVEISYYTFNTMIAKLNQYHMEVYRYLNAKIEYDNGQLEQIIEEAKQIYRNYRQPEKEKSGLYHWLTSTKIKLESAFQSNDELLISYIVSTNTWILLEGIWAVNNKPMPPSSTAFRNYKDLHNTPNNEWFDNLLLQDNITRGKIMYKTIEWILPQLSTD